MLSDLIESDGCGRCQYFLAGDSLRHRSFQFVARLHAVHFLVRGYDKLVQRLSVDAKRRGADADTDTRIPVSTNEQRELRNCVFHALAEFVNLRADNFLHEGDKLVAAVSRQKIVLAQLSLHYVRD